MTKQRLTYVLSSRYKQWLTKGCFMFYKGDINNDWTKVTLYFVKEI